MRNFVWLVPVVVLTGLFFGCDNTQDGGENPERESAKNNQNKKGVTIEPNDVVIGKGVSKKFTAVVTGNGEPSWGVSGGLSGTVIDKKNGRLTVDANETAEKLIVTAKLPTGNYGEAVVRIIGADGIAKTGGITVNPRTIMLGPGEKHTFTTNLIGADAGNVVWSVEGSTPYTISGGALKVKQDETAETLTVKASFGGQDGTAVVTVLGNEVKPVPVNTGIYLSPQKASAAKRSITAFEAYNSVDDTPVGGLSWDVFGGAAGTKINDGSLYVAGVESAARLTVRAKSQNGCYGTTVVEVIGESDSPVIGTVLEAEGYLKISEGGNDAGNPIPLSVNINLDDTNKNGLADLFSAIQNAGKYVNLDLSACSMAGTTFNPGTDKTGKDLIVSLTLPDAAKALGKFGAITVPPYTVESFRSLKSIQGENIESIAVSALYKCTSLESINFPSVKVIEQFAFMQCTGLKSVNLPAVTTIEHSAFYETALVSVNFPVATKIGVSAFNFCKYLKSVNLPVAEEVGVIAFNHCDSLTDISLPAATKIDNSAFTRCGNLNPSACPW